MFRNILSTVGARYLVAFLNLLLIFINSKVLGLEGVGLTGVILASSGLVIFFNSILCGNTTVYFLNRYNLRYVFYPSLAWAVTGSIAACCVMSLLKMLPQGYEVAIGALAALSSLVSANTLMLLGKDRVKAFNWIYIVQGGLQFVMLLIIYFLLNIKTVSGYLTGVFVANAVAFIISIILLAPFLKNDRQVEKPFGSVLKEMLVYGIWSGIDNLAEGLTTRLNYFLLNRSGGYGKVGLLDSGTKIAESVWHISNSISYLEYNSVSKTTALEAQKRVTLQLFKLTFCALLVVMAAVVCIPEWFYTEYLLTEEFSGVRRVIAALSPGIVAYGSNRIISHYFIGSGRIRYSAYCSLCGLAALVAVGFVLIPVYGVVGAAASSSLAYCCMLTYSVTIFCRQTRARLKDFLPVKADFIVKKIR